MTHLKLSIKECTILHVKRSGKFDEIHYQLHYLISQSICIGCACSREEFFLRGGFFKDRFVFELMTC